MLLTLSENSSIFEKGLAADLHSQHLHAQTLPLVMSLAVFLILFYLLIIFSLNYKSSCKSSVEGKYKTRKSVATEHQDLVCYDIKLVSCLRWQRTRFQSNASDVTCSRKCKQRLQVTMYFS